MHGKSRFFQITAVCYCYLEPADPEKDGYNFLGFKTNLNKDFDFANTTVTKGKTEQAR